MSFDEPIDPSRPINQQIQHQPVSARIPGQIGRGVFSTGAIVFEGANEFLIDFVQRLGNPHIVAARIVLSHAVFGQFIHALRENLKMYSDRFGAPPKMPTPHTPGTPQEGQAGGATSGAAAPAGAPASGGGAAGGAAGGAPAGGSGGATPTPPHPPQQTQHAITDLYDQLKLPDEMLSGVYANGVLIGHSPAEFWFDFITNFYPRSAVSARVFLTAAQIPGLVDALNSSYQAFLRKHGGGETPQG
jgi:hypothetical protein